MNFSMQAVPDMAAGSRKEALAGLIQPLISINLDTNGPLFKASLSSLETEGLLRHRPLGACVAFLGHALISSPPSGYLA